MVTPETRSQNGRGVTSGSSKSPGEQLRQAREAVGASLSAVAARTKISETTLFHLENDMYDEFAVELFLKGHLRSYARDLGLEPDRIVRCYELYIASTPYYSNLVEHTSEHTPSSEGGHPLEDSQELSGTVISRPVPHDPGKHVETRRSTLCTPLLQAELAKQPIGKKRGDQLCPRISASAISGSQRKVITRFSTNETHSHVRRGPSPTQQGLTARKTKQILKIADKIFSRSSDPNPVGNLPTSNSHVALRQRLNGAPSPKPDLSTARQRLRRSSSALTITTDPNTPQPTKSKLERALPQLKQFGAKHFIAIIVALVGAVIVAGLLSGNRATAQDPAKFPKNSQDSWELERQAEQTRWLLEQPDGQIESNKDHH